MTKYPDKLKHGVGHAFADGVFFFAPAEEFHIKGFCRFRIARTIIRLGEGPMRIFADRHIHSGIS